MEGPQGPNIAQISSMQQHAAGGEEGGIYLFKNMFPCNCMSVDFASSTFGNLTEGMSSFINQSMTTGGFASFMGNKPWAMMGLNILGRQAMFNMNAEATHVLGENGEQITPYEAPHMEDMGSSMANAGMQYEGEAMHISPPQDTPMMDHNPILDQSSGMQRAAFRG